MTQPAPHVDEAITRLAAELRARRVTRYERYVKPWVDRVAAALLLVLLLPVFTVVCAAVLVVIGRPVLFGQRRAGRDGHPFTMLKFRTMLPDRRRWDALYSGPDRRLTHKSPDDPRHTTLGRWMRKLSLDELPQLVNVVRGEMSLVGPRPELVHLVDAYAPWQHTRHLVKPGVTGLWQTTQRGEGHLLHECIDLDLRYIRDLSLWRDVVILLKTPFALLRNKGVI